MFTYYTQDHKILSDTISYYLFSDDTSIRELCSILEGFLKHVEHIVEHNVDILIPICKKSIAELKTFEANTTRGSDAAALASQCIIHADRFMEFMETKVDNKKEIQGLIPKPPDKPVTRLFGYQDNTRYTHIDHMHPAYQEQIWRLCHNNAGIDRVSLYYLKPSSDQIRQYIQILPAVNDLRSPIVFGIMLFLRQQRKKQSKIL